MKVSRELVWRIHFAHLTRLVERQRLRSLGQRWVSGGGCIEVSHYLNRRLLLHLCHRSLRRWELDKVAPKEGYED